MPPKKKYVCCFSGGKDSTAMLIYILENKLQLDEILYVDVGNWIWKSAKQHLEQVKEKLNVDITVLDVSDELDKGFQRWGFPSFLNRWCTGVKRDAMRNHLREQFGGGKLLNISDTVPMKKQEPIKNCIVVMR